MIMSVSRPTSPVFMERSNEDEGRRSHASDRSRVSSVLELMMDRMDNKFAKMESLQGEVKSQVGALQGEVRSQVGALQGEVRTQVGEIMYRLDRLETSPTFEGQLAVESATNPDCSRSVVATNTVAVPIHSSHPLVPQNADTSGLRRSERLVTQPRVNYHEYDKRGNRSYEIARIMDPALKGGLNRGKDPRALQRGESPMRPEVQVTFGRVGDFATLSTVVTCNR